MKKISIKFILSTLTLVVSSCSAQPTEETLALIKPPTVAALHTGAIIAQIEAQGFKIVSILKKRLSQAEAEEFYQEHQGRSFFPNLISMVTSGPIVALRLRKENAISSWRELLGATDPAAAKKGTIRDQFGTSKTENAGHGSDSNKSALRELALFFPQN